MRVSAAMLFELELAAAGEHWLLQLHGFGDLRAAVVLSAYSAFDFILFKRSGVDADLLQCCLAGGGNLVRISFGILTRGSAQLGVAGSTVPIACCPSVRAAFKVVDGASACCLGVDS